MPSWRTLPQGDLTALAAYVETLHQPAKGDQISPEALQHGNQIFLQNCAPCHGVSGDGKGAAAATLMPEPANFKLKQPDFDYILQVLSDGIPGTAMPAWKNQISESDRRALADFLRSLLNLPTRTDTDALMIGIVSSMRARTSSRSPIRKEFALKSSLSPRRLDVAPRACRRWSTPGFPPMPGRFVSATAAVSTWAGTTPASMTSLV